MVMMTCLYLRQDRLDLGIGLYHGIVHLLHVVAHLLAQLLALRHQIRIGLNGGIMRGFELGSLILGQRCATVVPMMFAAIWRR